MSILNLFPSPIYREPATLVNYDPVQLEVKAVLEYIKTTGDTSEVSYTYTGLDAGKSTVDGFLIKDNIVKTHNMQKLEERILSAVEVYTAQSGWFGLKREGKFILDNSWINISKRGIFHEYHCHPGYTIGGVYYFRVNELQGGINFNNPNAMMYNMMFPAGNKYPASINLIPSDGDIILFPAWLQHSTDPNRTDEERVSIAFNINYVPN